MLDHTLVLWTNEIGLHPVDHARASMGVVLAGARDSLRNGRFLDLSGYLYQDLLFTLAHVAGHTGLERFGDDGSRLIETLFA